MLQPPTFSDMDNAPNNNNNNTPTSSQPTTPSGEEPQQTVIGAGDGKGKRVINEEWKTIERQLFLQDPQEVFGNVVRNAGLGLKGVLAEEMVWPRSGFGDVWVRGVCRGGEAEAGGEGRGKGGGGEGEKNKTEGGLEREEKVNEETELDAYAQLLPLSSRPENRTGGAIVSSGGRGNLGVVSSMAATRSVTVNGVTKTEYILKRRFSDGQEEMLQKRITRSS